MINGIKEIASEEWRIVLKPAVWSGWKWIKILDSKTIGDDFYENNIKDSETLIIQEKIESYPININWVRKDWNLRVLVTYDFIKKKYITSWIIWRIDKDWWPVNISLTADYIKFEEISKLAWWTKKEFKEINKKVKETAEKWVTAIANRSIRKPDEYDKFCHNQDLAWVDIIVNRKMIPYIIEMNPANSCWPYQVMKNNWIEAIYPIANAILAKATLVRIILDNKKLD